MYSTFGETYYTHDGGYGGGGGYTTTKLGVDVNPGDVISVVVGRGGSGSNGDRGGGNGSSSSVGEICSANGGTGGVFPSRNGVIEEWNNSTRQWELIQLSSNGGSAGGAGSYIYVGDNGATSDTPAGKGAIDGSDSGKRQRNTYGYGHVWIHAGQGTTTRYFGESTGTLYSTGGCGGAYFIYTNFITPCGSITDQIANTGNGGNGQGRLLLTDNTVYSASDGCSGICIIRWGDQKS